MDNCSLKYLSGANKTFSPVDLKSHKKAWKRIITTDENQHQTCTNITNMFKNRDAVVEEEESEAAGRGQGRFGGADGEDRSCWRHPITVKCNFLISFTSSNYDHYLSKIPTC